MDDDFCILIPQLLLCSYVYSVPKLEDGLFIGERSKFRRALDQPQNNLADFKVEVCSGILLFRRFLWSRRAGGRVTSQKSGVTRAIVDEKPGP